MKLGAVGTLHIRGTLLRVTTYQTRLRTFIIIRKTSAPSILPFSLPPSTLSFPHSHSRPLHPKTPPSATIAAAAPPEPLVSPNLIPAPPAFDATAPGASVILEGPAGIVCVAIAALYALLMLAKTLLSDGPGPARFDELVMLLTTAALVFVFELDGAAVIDDEAFDVAEASAEEIEVKPGVALAADAPPCAWTIAVRKKRMSMRAEARNVDVDVELDIVAELFDLVFCVDEDFRKEAGRTRLLQVREYHEIE